MIEPELIRDKRKHKVKMPSLKITTSRNQRELIQTTNRHRSPVAFDDFISQQKSYRKDTCQFESRSKKREGVSQSLDLSLLQKPKKESTMDWTLSVGSGCVTPSKTKSSAVGGDCEALQIDSKQSTANNSTLKPIDEKFNRTIK